MSSHIVRPQGRSANIFINYRREDSSGHAGRLFDALSVHFAGRLFMDIDTLEPGVDFVEAIEQAVGSCEVLLVVIGREWLAVKDAAGHRRLDDPADFVRLEVESALARKIRVIPVLVQDAPMPRAEELPPSLARLARRNAIEISDARWAYDVDRLARTIQDILEAQEASAPAPAAVPEGATLPPAPVAPAVAAKALGPQVWLLSLVALVLVAGIVLASVLWIRRAPDDRAPIRRAKLEGVVTAPAGVAPTGSPASSEPTAKLASHAVGANGAPATGNGAPAADHATAEPPMDPAPARVFPVSKPSRKASSATVPLHDEPSERSKRPAANRQAANSAAAAAPPSPRATILFGDAPSERSKSPAADLQAATSVAAVAVQPPRFTITSPGSGETVGASVQVQGTVLRLGDHRAFLCIRQNNGSIYPRGELFPQADGQWTIQLRSSKEKTFEILVVTSATKEASQALSDQRSRDDGLPILPVGASISSGVVPVKRQGKLRDIFNSN
jgi:hypothetical protein